MAKVEYDVGTLQLHQQGLDSTRKVITGISEKVKKTCRRKEIPELQKLYVEGDRIVGRLGDLNNRLRVNQAAIADISGEYKKSEKFMKAKVSGLAAILGAIGKLITGILENIFGKGGIGTAGDGVGGHLNKEKDSGTGGVTKPKPPPTTNQNTKKYPDTATAQSTFDQKKYSEFQEFYDGRYMNTGCSVTATAYALTAMGFSSNPLDVYKLNGNDTSMQWNKVSTHYAPNLERKIISRAVSNQSLASAVDSANANPNSSPIMLFHHTNKGTPHYIVVKNVIRDANNTPVKFTIFDPYNAEEKNIMLTDIKIGNGSIFAFQ